MSQVSSEMELAQEVERLRAALATREQEAAEKERQLERYAADLRETFKQERTRSQELRQSYAATVRALANAVEFRDAYTARHAERVTAYGLEIARRMNPPIVEGPAIEFGFLLHDIGKVAISDTILHKPEPLSDAERKEINRHPEIGAEIVQGIAFLEGAAEIVLHHHEHWDGHGYPAGLEGEDIPLAARVFAVADVFDALTTKRPYRDPSSYQEARKMITAEAGTHFDPAVVEAFNSLDDETFARIAAEIG